MAEHEITCRFRSFQQKLKHIASIIRGDDPSVWIAGKVSSARVCFVCLESHSCRAIYYRCVSRKRRDDGRKREKKLSHSCPCFNFLSPYGVASKSEKVLGHDTYFDLAYN
jgi:hypothetical protein